MEKLEVLVINDGSTDNSSAIAHEYQDKYPDTFRVIDKENGNYGSCVNRGLKEAKGKYIKILDADDSFHTKNFISYLKEICQLDVDLIITNFSYVFANKKAPNFETTYNFPNEIIMSLSKISKGKDFTNIEMHAVTYRTDALRSIGYQQTEGLPYTDQEWMFWPMTTVKKVYYLPLNLYQYLVGREGQTVYDEFNLDKFKKNIDVQKGILDIWKKNSNYGEAKIYLKNRIIYRMHYYYQPNILFRHQPAADVLRELDSYLESNFTDLYNLIGNTFILHKKFPYRYVKAWRKKKKFGRFNFYKNAHYLIEFFKKGIKK
jgi:glycosyltransferase involved in cell wall biosynthesis